MAQQTVLEWFYERVSDLQGTNPYLDMEFEEAKQMEKQQHEQTWNAAHQAGRFEGKGIAEENWQTFKQYYNETYKP